MSEADLLQPGNIVRERWKVVSKEIMKNKKKTLFFRSVIISIATYFYLEYENWWWWLWSDL
jgi:hypothetical protein